MTETRTYNDLNQLTQDVVDDGATVTTWLFTHDAGDNPTRMRKFDNLGVWDYTWNLDNRLIRVTRTENGVVTADVGFGYDSLGRMLTRDQVKPVSGA